MLTKTSELIEKLISATKANKLKWEYLEDELFALDILDNNFDFSGEYSTNGSFIAQFNNGYFILIDSLDLSLSFNLGEWSFSDNEILLIVVPSGQAKDIEVVNFDIRDSSSGEILFQSDLLRLRNLIKSRFPSVDAFIEDFMNDLPF